jgi:hypothetical protein
MHQYTFKNIFGGLTASLNTLVLAICHNNSADEKNAIPTINQFFKYFVTSMHTALSLNDDELKELHEHISKYLSTLAISLKTVSVSNLCVDASSANCVEPPKKSEIPKYVEKNFSGFTEVISDFADFIKEKIEHLKYCDNFEEHFEDLFMNPLILMVYLKLNKCTADKYTLAIAESNENAVIYLGNCFETEVESIKHYEYMVIVGVIMIAISIILGMVYDNKIDQTRSYLIYGIGGLGFILALVGILLYRSMKNDHNKKIKNKK